MTLDEYRARCAELAGVTDQYAAAAAAAEESYVDGRAALAAREACALAALREADRQVARATAAVDDTDAEAAALWAELGDVLGRRAAQRLGRLPDPALSTVDGRPALPLARAAMALARYRTGSARRRPSGWLLAALPVLGALSAAPVGIVARGLGPLGSVLLFAAPFAGLLPARAWMRRMFCAPLDAGAGGLTVLGGMAACGLLAVALR